MSPRSVSQDSSIEFDSRIGAQISADWGGGLAAQGSGSDQPGAPAAGDRARGALGGNHDPCRPGPSLALPRRWFLRRWPVSPG